MKEENLTSAPSIPLSEKFFLPFVLLCLLLLFFNEVVQVVQLPFS
jgi:hypothetical protein